MLKIISIFYFLMTTSLVFATNQNPIHYVALGDSYTIGTGTQANASWPAVVTERLKKKGVNIELTGNLGRNGWTSQYVIDYELPELRALKPNFVTLLIGTNDWVQGVDAATFRNNFKYICDQLLKDGINAKNIVIVTLPDFSVTPFGQQYANGRDISEGIKKFNQIIIDEAQVRGLATVDLFPFSQTMGQDRTLIAADGLHPSAKGYSAWADLIEAVFKKALVR